MVWWCNSTRVDSRLGVRSIGICGDVEHPTKVAAKALTTSTLVIGDDTEGGERGYQRLVQQCGRFA
jgi:hypothetical protein